VLMLISAQPFQSYAPKGLYLKMLVMDVLSVLEKTGRLGDAMEQNTTGVHEVLETTSSSVCLQLTIEDKSGAPVATISKSGCEEAGGELQTLKRLFVHDGSVYVIKSKSWYRKVSS